MNEVHENGSWKFVAYQTAPASEQMERDFLTLAYTLAAQSSHPAREDVARLARQHGCARCPLIGFQDFVGKGFGGAVTLPGENAPRAVLFGSHDFVAEAGLDVPAVLEVAARRWAEEGAKILFGGWDGYARGLMKFKISRRPSVVGPQPDPKTRPQP